MSDPIHDVEHYQRVPYGMQAWDIILAQGIGKEAAHANVIKYILRFQDKGGVEDLMKASVYLSELITLLESDSEVSSITGNPLPGHEIERQEDI